MHLTYFYPQFRENVVNKSNSAVNIRFFAKTSDIRNFSENIRSDVKTSEVATLMADHSLAQEMPQRYCNTFFYYCVAIMIKCNRHFAFCLRITKATVHCI